MIIRPAVERDRDEVWAILQPVIHAGETYPLPRTMSRNDALGYWFAPEHQVFVAEDPGGRGPRNEDGADQRRIVGTYYLRANQRGGGSHVANCGYMTAPWAGGRGVGKAMCEHSLAQAAARGFRAIQFNFVVSTNERAVGLWRACGFEIVGRLPRAFDHPSRGCVDALVMFRSLDDRTC